MMLVVMTKAFTVTSKITCFAAGPYQEGTRFRCFKLYRKRLLRGEQGKEGHGNATCESRQRRNLEGRT